MSQPDGPKNQTLDELVRDACSVIPVSKSEYRRRLVAFIEADRNEACIDARKEQIMQDFLSLTTEVDVDESILIDWREQQLSELQSEQKKGK